MYNNYYINILRFTWSHLVCQVLRLVHPGDPPFDAARQWGASTVDLRADAGEMENPSPGEVSCLRSPLFLHHADTCGDQHHGLALQPETQEDFDAVALGADLWGADVDEFKPERWEKGAPHKFAFMPFSHGPRACIGREFTLLEQKITLVGRGRKELRCLAR